MGNLRCGFDSLKDDVTVLESATSELLALSSEIESCLEEHSEQTESDLSDIRESLENTKETANTIEGLLGQPCGGPGWRQIEFLDFRDSDTPCPIELSQNIYPARLYACTVKIINPLTCDTISFPVESTYNRVCGRIQAYQFGTPDAFRSHHTSNRGINEAYLSGISITHGGTLGTPPASGGIDATHIWSFAAGITQDTSNPSLMPARCPCDDGSASPEFVDEDYFCESLIDVADPSGAANAFIFRECLWDGEGCAASSTCCSRIDHPYFIKELDTPTSDDINLRVCNANIAAAEDYAIELIELYVQ